MKRALFAGMAVAFAFGSTAAVAQDRAGWPDSFTVGTASPVSYTHLTLPTNREV